MVVSGPEGGAEGGRGISTGSRVPAAGSQRTGFGGEDGSTLFNILHLAPVSANASVVVCSICRQVVGQAVRHLKDIHELHILDLPAVHAEIEAFLRNAHASSTWEPNLQQPIFPLPFLPVEPGFQCSACHKCAVHSRNLTCCAGKPARQLLSVSLYKINQEFSHWQQISVSIVNLSIDITDLGLSKHTPRYIKIKPLMAAMQPTRESWQSPAFAEQSMKNISVQSRNFTENASSRLRLRAVEGSQTPERRS